MVGNIFTCSESPNGKGICNIVDPLLYGQLVFKNLLAVKGGDPKGIMICNRGNRIIW